MTEIVNEPFDFVSAPHISSDIGDSAMLWQSSRTVLDTGFHVQKAVRALRLRDFTVKPGSTTAVSGVMERIVGRDVTLFIRMFEFSQMNGLVHPTAHLQTSKVMIRSIPVTFGAGLLGELKSNIFGAGLEPVLLVDYFQPGWADINSTFEVGKPDPAWSEFAEVSLRFNVPVQLPSSSEAGIVPVLVYRRDSVAGLLGAQVRPSMLPPTSVRVDGTDAWHTGETTLTSTTPLIEWAVSSSSEPDGYELEVFEVRVVGVSTRAYSVARVVTSQPAIRIPPGVVESGRSYSFTVSAFNREGLFDERSAPLLSWYYEDSAGTATSLFTAP